MIQVLECAAGSAAENLAGDEALLNAVDEAVAAPALRFWESSTPTIVLGRSAQRERDVTERADIPVLRRTSGGGTVVVGPGCLNFSIVLRLDQHPMLVNVRDSYHLILTAIQQALRPERVDIRGVSDLALNGRKFSGSAQRRTRSAVLHHATILYDFPLDLISRYLREPHRQPRYRRSRTHEDFLCNLPLAKAVIEERIANAFERWT